MLKTCPGQLCTVCRRQSRVARREAAEQAGSPLRIISSGQEKASRQSSWGGGRAGSGGGWCKYIGLTFCKDLGAVLKYKKL